MKQPLSSSETFLQPLQKKFKDAGCECSLKINKHQTILSIGYANIAFNNQFITRGNNPSSQS